MMFQCDLKKEKLTYSFEKRTNYTAIAFTTGGADAPPMTKEEKGRRLSQRSRKNVINANEGPMRVQTKAQ